MSRTLAEHVKDKDEAIAYTIEWAADLNGGTLSSVTWTVPTGITSESQTTSGTTSTIRLAGGTAGRVYRIEAIATSSNAEDIEAGFTVRISA